MASIAAGDCAIREFPDSSSGGGRSSPAFSGVCGNEALRFRFTWAQPVAFLWLIINDCR